MTVKTARARPGIQLHRSIVLTNADVRTYERIRITSPARTLLDIAPRLDDDELARALSDSSAARHLYLDALRNLLRRSRGVPGAARLAVLVGDYAPTRSEFEDGFRRFVRSHQLPEPQMNVKVAGYLVDALFAPERVIVELDGYDYHRDPGAFERDRKRDTVTLAAGYETARLTWTRMINTPHPEAELLHAILAARREGFRPVGGAVRRDRP